MNPIRHSLLGAAVVLAFGNSSAFAADVTTSFSATAEIIASCTVSAENLAFGTIDPLNAANTDASNDITVACSNTTTYDVGLDLGLNEDAGTVRQMIGGTGTDLLAYELYQEAGRTTVWGNAVGTTTVDGTGSGVDQTHTVFGRVAQQSMAPIGTYSDTIAVNVTY